MKINQEIPKPHSRFDSINKPSALNPIHLDLSKYSNNLLNKTLEFNGMTVGHIIIKNDIFYLKLDENAPEITISGFPLQKKLVIDASNDINIAHENDSTLEALHITANNISLKTTLNVTKGVLLEAKQNLVIFDALSSEAIECRATTFENNGPMHADISLIIKSDVIHQNSKVQSNGLIINSRSFYTGKNSTTIIKEHSLIIANSATLRGSLQLGTQLFCKIGKLHIAGALKELHEAYFDCNQLKISQKGSIKFNPVTAASESCLRTIQAKKIRLRQGALVTLDRVNLSTTSMDSMATLTINNSRLEIDTLHLEGPYSIKNSRFFIEKTISLQGDMTSSVFNTKIEAENVNFKGHDTCQNIEFIADNLLISSSHNTSLSASRLDVSNIILLEEQSQVTWENCQIYTESLQCKGKISLKNCEVESATCLTSAQTDLHETTIEARLFWQDEGAFISECSVVAESTSLLNKTSIEKTNILTQSFSYTSNGQLTDCRIKVSGTLSGSNISNLTFKHCVLGIEQTYTEGVLNFTDKSFCKTNYLQQSVGTIQINDSIIQNTSLMFSLPNTTLSVKNDAKITVNTALFHGATNWNASSFKPTGPVVFCGMVTGDKAIIDSKDTIYFSNNEHALDNSQLNSKKEINVTSSLILSKESTVDCDTFKISGKTTLLDNSKITAQDLKVLNTFFAKKSSIHLQSTLKLYNGSSVEIEDGPVHARDMLFFGSLKIARSELIAEKNIIFGSTSKSDLQVVKLKAAQDIQFANNAQATGKNVETKSNHLGNAGELKIDNLSVDAITIHNAKSIKSDESVQFKAHLGMVNTGSIAASSVKIQASSLTNATGKIHSVKNTTIQAPLIINYMGDISSSGTLSMDSLEHFNIMGVERAYNFNSRTLHDYNYGLVLCNLPHSMKEIFTYERGLSILKMGFTQALPKFGNLISLGFMAAPYVKESTKFLYNFCKSDEKLKDLPAKIYDAGANSIRDFKKKFEITGAADYLPVMLEAMNTLLTLNQAGNAAFGAWNELNPEKAPPSPTNDMKEPASSNPETPVENNTNHFSVEDGINIAAGAVDMGIKIFGPSITTQSVISDHAGVVLSVNLMESSYHHTTNHGIKGSWNMVGNYKTGVNRGIFVGANMVVTGKSYDNYGNFAGVDKANLLFTDYFANAENADCMLNNFSLKTDKVINAGNLASEKGTMEANNFEQTQTGKAKLVKTSAIIREKASFQGDYCVTAQSTVVAKDVSLDGTGIINQSTILAENKVTQTGSAIAKESLISGENLSLDGIKAIDSTIIAKNDLHIKNANTSGTTLSAHNAWLANSTFEGKKSGELENNTNSASDETLTTSEKAEIEPAKPASDDIKIGDKLHTDNVVMKNMQISSNTHHDVDGIYIKTQLVTAKDFTGKNTQLDNSALYARNAALQGQTVANHSQVIVEKKLTQTGNLTGEEAYLSGENVQLDGIQFNKSTVIAENKLTIKNANTMDTGISGKEVDLRDSKFKSSQLPKETAAPEPAKEKTEEKHEEATAQSESEEELGHNQIRASGTLHTQNVEMEGQSIQANRMEANHTKMQTTQVKVKKDLIAQDVKTNKCRIDTNTASFRGTVSMKDTVTKARDSIDFDKDATIRTHNAEYISKNKITHRSKNHKQTGSLVLESKEVNATETSNIRSGSGSNNSFYVKAKKGNFKGSMRLDEGVFEVEKLAHAEDLIAKRGQSSKQTFTKSLTVNTNQTIDIKNMKPRDCDVAVVCDAVTVSDDYKSTKDVTFIATKGKVLVNADLHGNKVALQSEKSDVVVKGKTVSANTLVHVDAEGDVIVTATEKSYQGKHDIEKKVTQGAIIGGSGTAESEGVGVIVNARNKVYVDASNICADGQVIVRGDKGVDITARTHTYTSEKWSKNKRCLGVKHGKKKYEKIDTQVTHSTFGSTKDRVQIISSKGEVQGIGADFIAKNGADIYGEKDVKLQKIITQTEVRKQNSSGFGLNSKKSKHRFQNVKLVEFVDDGGHTRIHSNTGDVTGRDVRFRGKGDLKCSAPQGKVDFKASKLNHSSKTKEKKFSLSSPPVQSAKQMLSEDKKRLIKQAEPGLNHVEALINAKKPVEMAAGAVNTAVNGYNTLSAIQAGNYGQQLVQGAGFIPKINLTYAEKKSSSHTQTGTGAGIFKEGAKVVFESKYAVNLEGMPIEGDSLHIKTDKISLKGQGFDSSFKTKTRSATVGVDVSGNTDASFSQSSSNMKSRIYQNMGINIKNEIDIEADSMVMDAANMESDTVKIKLNKLTIQSRQDELNVKSQSAHASTSGTAGFHQSSTNAKQTTQISGIHVRSNIEKGDMQIKEVELIGSSITSDGYNGFEPEKLTITALKDHSHTQGFGISGNVKSIANALNDAPSSRLTTATVSHEKRDYQADIKATVYGKNGVSANLVRQNPELNTSTSTAKTVTRDTGHHITLDVPVEIVKSSVKTGFTFFEKTLKPDNAPAPLIDLEKSVMPDLSNGTPMKDEILVTTQPQEASDETRMYPAMPVIDEPENPVMDVLPTENLVDDLAEIPAVNEDAEAEREAGTFNPKLKTKTVGLKNGANQQQLYNKNNGQYTNLTKEMKASAKDNTLTKNIELVLMSGGDKQDGPYYQAKIDPLSRQLTIETGVGEQYCYNLANTSAELEYVGKASVTVDAFSATALVKSQVQVTSHSASATASGELGVMGPSGTGTYTTPCFSFMGLTLQITGQVSAGIGLKAVAAVGAEADAKKMKVSAVGKVGFFVGGGAQVTIKPEIGVDMEYLKAHLEACEEYKKDDYTMTILGKLKNYEPLSAWESEYFNDMMDEVTNRAMFNSWFGPKK